MIERKCQNCSNNKYCNHIQKEEWTCYCEDYKYFVPREKFIRADERRKLLNKIIEILKETDTYYASTISDGIDNIKEYFNIYN